MTYCRQPSRVVYASLSWSLEVDFLLGGKGLGGIQSLQRRHPFHGIYRPSVAKPGWERFPTNYGSFREGSRRHVTGDALPSGSCVCMYSERTVIQSPPCLGRCWAVGINRAWQVGWRCGSARPQGLPDPRSFPQQHCFWGLQGAAVRATVVWRACYLTSSWQILSFREGPLCTGPRWCWRPVSRLQVRTLMAL